MKIFKQFDISDVFNEVTEPLFIIDEQEIIFINNYFSDHFKIDSDSWREIFKDKFILNELADYFENGSAIQNSIVVSLENKFGEHVLYEWTFVKLPSSYTNRHLIVRGHKMSIPKPSDSFGLNQKENFLQRFGYLQSILFNSQDLISILDKEGFYTFVSPSVCEKLGIQSSELIGSNYKDLVKTGLFELVKGDFADLMDATSDISLDFWVHRSDGNNVYLETYAKNLTEHPQIQGYLLNSRDITQYIESVLSLQRRSIVESLISKISKQLINNSSIEVEELFHNTLIRLNNHFKAVKSQIFIFNGDIGNFKSLSILKTELTEEDDYKESVLLEFVQSNLDSLRKGDVVHFTSNEEEIVLIPMISTTNLSGVIVLVLPSLDLKGKEIQALKQLGDILATAFQSGQMTKQIRRNENLLASAELVSKSGSWRFSNSDQLFFISDGLAHLFGFDDRSGVATFSTLVYKISKSTRKGFVSNLKLAINKGDNTFGEFLIKNENGKLKYVSYEIEPRRDLLTLGLEIYGHCTDVSHKRAADDYPKLQSQILAQVTDPIIVTTPDLKIIYLNEAAIDLCKISSQHEGLVHIQDLISFKLNSDQVLSEITNALPNSQVWEEVGFLNLVGDKKIPFEISIKGITLDTKNSFGFSFILRSLEHKYESERVARPTQMIVENSPAVLFRVDPDSSFKIHYLSENISQFGYSAADLISTSFLDLLHPEDAIVISEYEIINRSTHGVSAFSGEYRIIKADGEIAWVEDKTREVFNEEGKIILHEGLFQDITDRKNLEIFNRKKDKEYRILASNIPSTNIFLLDKNRKFILAEGTNFKKWGLTARDFEGKYIDDFSLTDVEVMHSLLDRVYNNKEIIESKIFYKDRYYQRTIRPIIEDGEVEFVMSLIRDIHEQQLTEDSLLASEEKFRTLVEESTEIIFSISMEMKIIYISPNIYQFLGFTVEEVIGKSILNYLIPEDLEVFHRVMGERDFLAENQYLEFRILDKSGEYRVLNSNGRLVEGKNKEHYYTGIARDITKLKETQRVLVKAKDSAEQASQVKSQFLSVMSHEIRTPLNAVIGLSHLLMEESPRPDQYENLRTLQFSAERLMGLINDILDFNKIDSGKIELENVPFDFRFMIDRIVHSHSFTAREKGLTMTLTFQDNIPQFIFGDPIRLGQIINNLVSNALKFTEKGYVNIDLQKINQDNNLIKIHFVIEDSGIGIPENKREDIFEAFTQASSSTTREFGGTGLGLAIVKRLLELHGSKIILTSEVNAGSKFEFELDFLIETKLETNSTDKLPKPPKSLNQASILVAEDNVVNQILIKKFLKKWNVGHVEIATDGQEAIDLFEKGNFNILLLDLQMPVLDGIAVAKHIRNMDDKSKKNIPIVVFSATSYEEIRGEMDKIGINDFVSKPFTPEGLYDKLTQYLLPKDIS
jgi:PAS domain S-box-containing protein